MTESRRLAAFAVGRTYDDLSEDARRQVKIRILDALGCAAAALDGEPIRFLRAVETRFGGNDLCTLIGGGRTAPDRAALMNGALVRYVDFNDSYLAPGETCHPSDVLGALLAAGESVGASGRDLMTAMAVSYQVQCRLSDEAPVRAHGFDHTVQGVFGAACGVARILGLDAGRAANAIGIAGTALNALRVTRTGTLSHWKGLASPFAVAGAVHAAYLAAEGVTGPPEVFEGNKGFREILSGAFTVDWEHEDLERVRRTILKKYNAEIHSQSALEAVLDLQREHGFTAEEVDGVDLEVFDVAYNIIGGGEEGDKTRVESKEQADHSLPYMVAVALLDGQVLPAQYAPERIGGKDVQDLLRRVSVRPAGDLSKRFPEHHPCRVRVCLRDGREFRTEKEDYEGFHTRPLSWDSVAEKFHRLAEGRLDPPLDRRLVDTVAHLESVTVSELMEILAWVRVDSLLPV